MLYPCYSPLGTAELILPRLYLIKHFLSQISSFSDFYHIRFDFPSSGF